MSCNCMFFAMPLLSPGRTGSWPTAQQPIGFQGPPGHLGTLFLIDAADSGTPCRASHCITTPFSDP